MEKRILRNLVNGVFVKSDLYYKLYKMGVKGINEITLLEHKLTRMQDDISCQIWNLMAKELAREMEQMRIRH